MKVSGRLVAILVGSWLPIVIIIAWWTASADSANPYFPPLSEIMSRFTELWFSSEFTTHVVPSLRNLTFGFALGCILGIGGGTIIGGSR